MEGAAAAAWQACACVTEVRVACAHTARSSEHAANGAPLPEATPQDADAWAH
jgi:hypothetical protein